MGKLFKEPAEMRRMEHSDVKSETESDGVITF